MKVPILSSERLRLRPLRRDDAPAMFAFAQDLEIAAMGLWEPLLTLDACSADIEATLTNEARSPH